MATPSQDYIDSICSLYNSSYDDRIENTAPPTAGDTTREPGEDWMPGTAANHKSLIAFQKELKEQGIKLSTSKIKKILVTGGLWTTQQTRLIQPMFAAYTANPHTVNSHTEDDKNGVENAEAEDGGMDPAAAIKRIAEELDISVVSVSVSFPYSSVVYNLPEPSSNAKRCRRWKERKAATSTKHDTTADEKKIVVDALQRAGEQDWKASLWRCVVAYEGHSFQTSGRGSRPGVSFSYMISRAADQKGGGRRYGGEAIPGYGNELWVTTQSGTEEEAKLKKSISRSTVELGYRRAVEMHGVVKGPKALGLPGIGSYIYPMLVRFGVIKKQGEA